MYSEYEYFSTLGALIFLHIKYWIVQSHPTDKVNSPSLAHLDPEHHNHHKLWWHAIWHLVFWLLSYHTIFFSMYYITLNNILLLKYHALHFQACIISYLC